MCAGGGKHPQSHKAHAARGARERAAPNIVQAGDSATGRVAGADAPCVPSPGVGVGVGVFVGVGVGVRVGVSVVSILGGSLGMTQVQKLG